LLAQAGFGPGGHANGTGKVPLDVRREVSATLAYLIDTHGVRSLRSVLWDSPALAAADTMTGTGYGQGEKPARAIMNRLGMEYVARWQTQSSTYFSYNGRRGSESVVTPTSDVDYHVRLPGFVPQRFQTGATAWELGPGRRGKVIRLATNGHTAAEFPTDTLVTLARLHGAMDPGPWPKFTVASDYARATLVVLNFTGTQIGDSTSFTNLEGDLYLKVLPAARP
jgi:hypothetical protein